MPMLVLVDSKLVASLEYNPFTRQWTVQRSDEAVPQLVAKLEASSLT